MTLLLIGIATGISTFVGGSLALRFKNQIHLILGFSAGAVIGVALFDLFPEAIDIGQKFHTVGTLTTFIAIGFMAYMILDRTIPLVTSKESGHRGHVGAGSLTIHSFLDGLGIGLAFQVSPALGAIVAVAVLVHDFSDGINTVNLSLVGTGKPKVARLWLFADALAPLVGIGVSLLFAIPEQSLSIILSLFSGFFLYIGASELLPDSHHRHPRFLTSIMTVLGAGVIYGAIQLASF
ncbi:ZIP family metal transporter [Patescibacteria group bacterium]|nr:ZIP family metal transporter [Patescibacteria group bacterium]